MRIAGIAIEGIAVLGLAERLVHAGHMDTAALLLTAQASGDERIGLHHQDREAVLSVLRDAPDGLSELRAALMAEDAGRVCDRRV
jgi:hypothetical protein